MDTYELAALPKDDFGDLVISTGRRMGIKDALVEKDFWVTFVLKYIFEDSPWRHGILFKGGTSLSKCYNAIQRFSEDVDLLLDWRLLGYGIGGPARGGSRSSRRRSTANWYQGRRRSSGMNSSPGCNRIFPESRMTPYPFIRTVWMCGYPILLFSDLTM